MTVHYCEACRYQGRYGTPATWRVLFWDGMRLHLCGPHAMGPFLHRARRGGRG